LECTVCASSVSLVSFDSDRLYEVVPSELRDEMKLAVLLAILLPRVVRLCINCTVSTRALLMAMNISVAGEDVGVVAVAGIDSVGSIDDCGSFAASGSDDDDP